MSQAATLPVSARTIRATLARVVLANAGRGGRASTETIGPVNIASNPSTPKTVATNGCGRQPRESTQRGLPHTLLATAAMSETCATKPTAPLEPLPTLRSLAPHDVQRSKTSIRVEQVQSWAYRWQICGQ